MSLFDDLPEICRRQVPLAAYTWFKLGGPAEYFLEPRSEEQLGLVVRRCRDSGTPIRFLGLGANVLVRDEGVRGVVVRLSADFFNQLIFDGDRLVAGGGVDLTRLVRTSVRRAMAGLETIAGIPGTVGGGIAMNCGGRYGEIAAAVRSVRVMGPDGQVYERERDDLEFGYRACRLAGDCVLSATFALQEADAGELDRRFREVWMYKQNTQPPLGVHSAGCIFRNPNGRSAGEVIDSAGLKGLRIGSALVSQRHANFILADEGGRAADVIELIAEVQRRVKDRFGIELEPEVKIW